MNVNNATKQKYSTKYKEGERERERSYTLIT